MYSQRNTDALPRGKIHNQETTHPQTAIFFFLDCLEWNISKTIGSYMLTAKVGKVWVPVDREPFLFSVCSIG